MSRMLLVLLAALPLTAKLVRLEVSSRGATNDGAYERVVGKAHFAVDPHHRLNRGIEDIALAPRNAAGQVEFSADFYMLRPRAGGRSVLFEVSNRGGRGLMNTFGQDFLLREGHTLVWLGWQHDVAKGEDALRLYAPVLPGVTGAVRAEFVPNTSTKKMPLAESGHVPYAVSDDLSIRVTVRDTENGARRELTGFRREGGSLIFDEPLTPGKVYDAVYTARDAVPLMLGLAGIRDLIAHLRDSDVVRSVMAFGNSQSAMLLRALLYHGFNEDEQGRRVFDGILGNIAGGRRSYLGRFAQPSRTAAPLRALFYRTDEFPFADGMLTDPVTGSKDGVLTHLKASTLPKVMWTNSAYEYWGSAGSLLHTTLDGAKDVTPPPSTRIYMFAGGQHGPAAFPPKRGNGANLPSPNNYRWALRGLLHALRQWVEEGKAPPVSRYPRIADETLVSVPKLRKPGGLLWPDHQRPSYRIEGKQEPPRVGAKYGALVPQVDADGNDVAGLRMPEVAVPLGVYTGWNFRSAAIGQPGELLGGAGSFFPFSRDEVIARYGSREKYMARYEAAARELMRGRYLLSEDILELRKAAIARWDWAMQQGAPSGVSVAGSRAR
ncbi:MAG: hypothetical protein HY820_26025 [Acidobacteria bacterium]|nr:hypothetical protein [Acidobacteriota bacterium]